MENSIPAFVAAVDNVALGCSGVELDIHTSADGEFVVHHDPKLANGVSISETKWATLSGQRLADGSPLPRLEEALDAIGPLVAWIEIKAVVSQRLPALLRLLERMNRLDRDQLHSFDHRKISELARMEHRIGLGVLSSSRSVDPVAQVIGAGARVLWQNWEYVDGELVTTCAKSDIKVIAWTVPAEEEERLSQLGVHANCMNL